MIKLIFIPLVLLSNLLLAQNTYEEKEIDLSEDSLTLGTILFENKKSVNFIIKKGYKYPVDCETCNVPRSKIKKSDKKALEIEKKILYSTIFKNIDTLYLDLFGDIDLTPIFKNITDVNVVKITVFPGKGKINKIKKKNSQIKEIHLTLYGGSVDLRTLDNLSVNKLYFDLTGKSKLRKRSNKISEVAFCFTPHGHLKKFASNKYQNKKYLIRKLLMLYKFKKIEKIDFNNNSIENPKYSKYYHPAKKNDL